MTIEEKAQTAEEAINVALKKLGVGREKAKIEIISEGKKGVFGLGGSMAEVRVTVDDNVMPQEKKKAVEGSENTPAVVFLKRVFEGLGMEAKFSSAQPDEETEEIDISNTDSALIIGKKGKNIDALQYLANVALIRENNKKFKIVLDSEGYRARRREALTELAKTISEEVKATGKSVSLEPMSSYERRIIHLQLQDNPDVVTESTGDGEDRRVVIKVRDSK